MKKCQKSALTKKSHEKQPKNDLENPLGDGFGAIGFYYQVTSIVSKDDQIIQRLWIDPFGRSIFPLPIRDQQYHFSWAS